MNLSYRFVALVLTGSALALACLAQNTSPTLAGRWQGNYKIPGGQDLGVIVDLTKNPKGAWVGSFSMPEFQANDIPVEQLSVTQNQVHFVVSGVFGNPAFDGSLGSDGKLSGTFGDPQHKTPLALNRTGAAQVKLPEPSTPIGKDVEGTWHATLSAGDTQTRMLLKLSRAPDGTATGMMINVDQGNREVPLTSIHQKDQTLEFEIRPAVVHYRGTIKAPGGPISGDWTQMSRSAPLTFERGPFPANSQLPKAFEGTWQALWTQGRDTRSIW